MKHNRTSWLYLLLAGFLVCPSIGQADDLPDSPYDYDVSQLDIAGDITEMFRFDDRWVILADSSRLYSYSRDAALENEYGDFWRSQGWLLGNYFLAEGEIPLLVDPDKNVIRIDQMGTQDRQGTLDLATVYEVPRAERIYTALAFRTNESRQLMREVEELGHSSEGFPYDYVLGGEIKDRDGNWTSLLLVKEALDKKWREIRLNDPNPVLNLNLVRERDGDLQVLFTQGNTFKMMHEDDFDPYRLHRMLDESDSILCVKLFNESSLAGTQKGCILWADDIFRGWSTIIDDMRYPVIDIANGYIMTDGGNRFEVWEYRRPTRGRESGFEDVIDGDDLMLEFVYLPSLIAPLTTFSGQLICGENGYIAQRKINPFVEEWLSTYRKSVLPPVVIQPAAESRGASVAKVAETSDERNGGKIVRYLDPDPEPVPEPEPVVVPVEPKREPIVRPVEPEQQPVKTPEQPKPQPVEPKQEPVKQTDQPGQEPVKQTDPPKEEPVKKQEPVKQTDKPKSDPVKKQNQPK